MDHGGPSVTARRVAVHRLGFTRIPAPYGDPAADQALAADVAEGQESSPSRMRDYLAGRTRFFDQVVVSAIGRGVRQVVIGAAGYDGRAFRYAKPSVRWFEVDHPATQRDKRERLERLGIAARRVRFVEADFTRDPVAERLLAAGLDPARPSLFLLEGIAVYLEPAVLETVLSQFRQVASAASVLAISMALSGASAEARSRFAESVAALGEPVRSVLEADEVADLLARTGWRITPPADPGDPEAVSRRERLRSAGLLTARAARAARSAPATDAAAATDAAPVTGAAPATGAAPVTGAAPATGAAPVTGAAPAPPAPRTSSRRARPEAAVPAPALPLSALLSQTLVAFTIEADNEAEHRIPHWTTDYGASGPGGGPWLVSLVMWENCLRFVTDRPITARELETLARTGTNLDGMRRWGYLTIDGTARKMHNRRPGPDAVLRATANGLQARQAWLPLPGVIEWRWRERLGADAVDRMRDALLAVVGRLDPGLPDCLPIIGHALRSQAPDPALPPRPEPVDLATLPLSALLSRVLLSFAVEYEREAEPALAVGANVLRVLNPEGTRLRDLPGLTGTSREAVRWALGILLRARLAVEEPDPAAGRGKLARLTPAGTSAQHDYHEVVGTIEQRWRERFTDDTVSTLRQVLEPLATGSEGRPPPLFRGLEPYPDNWRARVGPPSVLPHYPMVLHRGGYPDGS